VYPQLDIMDAAFCVSVDGVQHNLRASKRMGSERLDLQIGPIKLEIVIPLQQLRLRVEGNDSPLTADIVFTARHAPIEEPRFTRRNGARLMMDYTRLTQNGSWQGQIAVAGDTNDVAGYMGTRDRSWGIRPVGAAESQPPPAGDMPQFWWLWAPLNFDGYASFFHSNDDEAGKAWNRRGALCPFDEAELQYKGEKLDVAYHPGTRRVRQFSVDVAPASKLTVTPRKQLFYMSGLGYLHPEWGHGLDHGVLDVGYDSIALDPKPATEMTTVHVQALSDAVLEFDGQQHRGIGVTEQLFLGPHTPSGLAGMLDPAA